MHISCVEIYNEAAYDLLAATRDAVRSLDDLQRVHLLEDANAHIHLRNLSVHRAATEEEALNLVRTPNCLIVSLLKTLPCASNCAACRCTAPPRKMRPSAW